jgi:hypothetical protein
MKSVSFLEKKGKLEGVVFCGESRHSIGHLELSQKIKSMEFKSNLTQTVQSLKCT